MDIVNLIIALISGAAGGNIAGAAMPEKSLGGVGNTISGLIGGGLGDFILKALGVLATTTMAGQTGTAATDFDLSSILASIGAGGASGGILTAVIALIKSAIEKNKT